MEKRSAGIPCSSLISSRSVMMGIATLMIIFVHSPLSYSNFPFSNSFTTAIWNSLYNLLFGGVDLFLFLSGMGLYYSFSKDSNVLRFYKKRFFRIIPELLLVSVLYLFLTSSSIGITELKYDLLLQRFLVSGDTLYWFFNLILGLYLIYPLIHMFIEKFQKVGFVCLLLLLVSGTLLMQRFYPGLYAHFGIAITRIPSFCIGVWFGKMAKSNKSVSWRSVGAACIVVSIIFVLAFRSVIGPYNTVFYRYSAAFFSIFFGVVSAHLITKLHWKPLMTAFIWLGGYSMEVYLIYEKVQIISRNKIAFYDSTGLVSTSFFIILTLFLSMLLKMFQQSFQNGISVSSSSANTILTKMN